MEKFDLSIVIVNWKVKDLLEKCLESIFRYQGNYKLEVFVIDNDSRDGSAEMVRDKFPQVNLMALDKNIGFGSANNLAIKRANSDYIFLLNPDTEISENFFNNIFNYTKKHPEVGIVGPKIVNGDGSQQESIRRFPDLLSQALILLKLKNLLSNNKIINNYLCKDFDYTKEQSVDQIMGAAMFIQKFVLDNIGSFDEKFFVWFEEVDLCKRAKDAGVKIKYFPGASIIHQGGKSFSKKNTLKKQLIFNKSLLHYFSKHKSFIHKLVLIILMPINIILTLAYVIFFKSKTE